MAIIRAPVYAALYSRIKSAVRAKTYSKRPEWEVLQAGDLPAVMVVAAGQRVVGPSGFPTEWILLANIFLSTPDAPGGEGSDILLALIDQVDAALDRPSSELGLINAEQAETTLGGACLKAYINGEITIDLFAGEPGWAHIPVEMMLVG